MAAVEGRSLAIRSQGLGEVSSGVLNLPISVRGQIIGYDISDDAKRVVVQTSDGHELTYAIEESTSNKMNFKLEGTPRTMAAQEMSQFVAKRKVINNVRVVQADNAPARNLQITDESPAAAQ